MTKTTVAEVLAGIQKVANENHARPKSKRVIHLPIMKVGTCYRQGDLFIFKVADDHPVGDKVERRQLADGESIGQRHVLLGDFVIYKGIKEPNIKFKNIPGNNKKGLIGAVLGYAFDVTGECRNNHPEHDDFIFHPQGQGRYQVWHQLNRETMQRVAD